MQIIPIKKSSIKKNSDAGKTEYSSFGGSTITGTWKGKMPEHHYNHITSMWPEPEYTFEYHNPLIECSECSKQVRFKDIKSGYIINEEGEEFNADECPNCGSLDSFKYRLQRIDEVQK